MIKLFLLINNQTFDYLRSTYTCTNMLNTAQEEAFTLFLFSKDEKSEKIYKNSPSCFTNKLPKRLFHQERTLLNVHISDIKY